MEIDIEDMEALFPKTHVKKLPYLDPIVEKLNSLDINGDRNHVAIQEQTSLVPYVGDDMMVPFEGPLIPTKKRHPRAKVDLDTETHRVWNLLMGKESSEAGDETESNKKKWEDERQLFRLRASLFVSFMNLIQGNRCFSPWKGSVVDSVVGAFLTQNVSDILSSSAFMSLAARFPLQSNGSNSDQGSMVPHRCDKMEDHQQKVNEADYQLEISPHAVEEFAQNMNSRVHKANSDLPSCSRDNLDVLECSSVMETENGIADKIVESNSKVEVHGSGKVPMETAENAVKGKKERVKSKRVKVEKEKNKDFDWDNLRKQVCQNGAKQERSSDTMDTVDWEAVRCADVNEISKSIQERGQHNVLAEQIKVHANGKCQGIFEYSTYEMPPM